MNKRSRVILLLSVSLLCLSVQVFALTENEKKTVELIEGSYKSGDPIWLIMERGKQAYELGEFGLAARVFREAIDRQSVNPDAHMWLGYIFEKEGEWTLAEKEYQQALKDKNQLYILEDRFTIMYRLADIYRRTDQWGRYERILIEVLEDDGTYQQAFSTQYAMVKVLKEKGLDKLFELYRWENNRHVRARRELGVFYYRTGRYNEAENNLVLAVMSAVTVGFDYILEKTADYDYTELAVHVENMCRYPELVDYMRKNEFFQSLYYLGASLYADGFRSRAEELWTLVAESAAGNSKWRARSLSQLREPFIEPVIVPRS